MNSQRNAGMGTWLIATTVAVFSRSLAFWPKTGLSAWRNKTQGRKCSALSNAGESHPGIIATRSGPSRINGGRMLELTNYAEPTEVAHRSVKLRTYSRLPDMEVYMTTDSCRVKFSAALTTFCLRSVAIIQRVYGSLTAVTTA